MKAYNRMIVFLLMVLVIGGFNIKTVPIDAKTTTRASHSSSPKAAREQNYKTLTDRDIINLHRSRQIRK